MNTTATWKLAGRKQSQPAGRNARLYVSFALVGYYIGIGQRNTSADDIMDWRPPSLATEFADREDRLTRYCDWRIQSPRERICSA